MSLQIRVLDHGDDLPSADTNIDVEVLDDEGRRWGATFYTLANVQTLLERWRVSGEHGSGAYFWGGPDGVIVREVSHESIERAVAAVIADDALEQVFQRLDE